VGRRVALAEDAPSAHVGCDGQRQPEPPDSAREHRQRWDRREDLGFLGASPTAGSPALLEQREACSDSDMLDHTEKRHEKGKKVAKMSLVCMD